MSMSRKNSAQRVPEYKHRETFAFKGLTYRYDRATGSGTWWKKKRDH